MTVLRALAGVLAHLPTFAFIYAPVEHVGDIHQLAPADEGCDCDEHDLDTAQPVLVLLPIASAADLFEQAGIRCRNGDDPTEVGWEMARGLELGGEL